MSTGTLIAAVVTKDGQQLAIKPVRSTAFGRVKRARIVIKEPIFVEPRAVNQSG